MIIYEQNLLVLNSSLWDKSQKYFIALVDYTNPSLHPTLFGWII